MGEREREQKGSEISDVGETRDVRPADEERLATSSKVLRITVLGSSPALPSKFDLVGLFVAEELESRALLGLTLSNSSAYSGNAEKLSGTTITWYVPGLEASALRSRSSSEVSREKAGRGSDAEKYSDLSSPGDGEETT